MKFDFEINGHEFCFCELESKNCIHRFDLNSGDTGTLFLGDGKIDVNFIREAEIPYLPLYEKAYKKYKKLASIK